MTFDFGVTRERDEATGVEIVAVRGEIDIATAPELERETRAAIENGATRLVLDLSETTFLDSTGLGVILGLSKQLSPPSGDLTLVNVDAGIAKTFEITGLGEILTVCDTRAGALSALR